MRSDGRPAGAYNDWRRDPGVLTIFVEDADSVGVGTLYRDLTREQAENLIEELRHALEHIDDQRMSAEEWDGWKRDLERITGASDGE